jgi:hypothetical protein
MATTNPRVQVTVDRELAEALAEVPGRGGSKSRLIRDLALRGARAEREDHRHQQEANEYLATRAAEDVDLDALREIHAERERSV